MKLVVDEDVAKVAEFMLRNCPALKLQKIARGLVQLGELIWPEAYPWQERPFFTFTVERFPFVESEGYRSSAQQRDASLPHGQDTPPAIQQDGRNNASDSEEKSRER